MYPGVDLIEIDRLAKALKRRPRLKQRLFSSEEISQCEQKPNPMESFAGRFAAKEAVLKSLGTGFKGLQWVEIEIINNSQGRPEVQLSGAAANIACSLGIYDLRVSISHSNKVAMAFAIALTREEIR